MCRMSTLFLLVVCLSGCFGSGGGGGGGNNGAPGTNADLSDLSLSAGPLDQVFQANQVRYTATVGFLAASTTVTPTTDDANATVTVNGVVVISGTASGPISLDEGPNNEISVIVTAEDGMTKKVYTVSVTRQLADEFAQQAYLKAFDAAENDEFGFSVALSGDTLAVGAVGKNSADNSKPDTGAVYVFTRNNGIWARQVELKAFDAEENDQFGSSVALSGDTLAVGAVGKNSVDNSKPDIGAVYVFTRDIDGDWTRQAELKAFDAEENDEFGFSVALSGDTLAVGTIGKNSADNSKPDIGAVYVFTRNNGIWTRQVELKALDARENDQFGFSVALSGDTLAVGAVGKNSVDNSKPDIGAVYVFTRDIDGDWTRQDLLRASNADIDDQFGFSVALSGDTLAVGSVYEDSSASGGQDDNSALDAGAVYVFIRNNNGVWSQQSYLKASNANAGDLFGLVALSADTLAVGAVGEDSSASGGQDDNSALDAGAVYVFIRNNNGVWSQQSYLKASNANADDQFGVVALSGDTLAVGAVGEGSNAVGGEEDNSAPGAGAVYVF